MTFVEPVSGILDRREPTKLAPPFNLSSRPQDSGIRSPWWACLWPVRPWRCNPVKWLTDPWSQWRPWLPWRPLTPQTNPWTWETWHFVCLFVPHTRGYRVFIYLFIYFSVSSRPWFRVSGREWWLDLLLAPVVLSPWEPWLSLACPWVLVSARLPISSSIHLALYNWKKKKNGNIFPPPSFGTLFSIFSHHCLIRKFKKTESCFRFFFFSFIIIIMILLGTIEIDLPRVPLRTFLKKLNFVSRRIMMKANIPLFPGETLHRSESRDTNKQNKKKAKQFSRSQCVCVCYACTAGVRGVI